MSAIPNMNVSVDEKYHSYLLYKPSDAYIRQ